MFTIATNETITPAMCECQRSTGSRKDISIPQGSPCKEVTNRMRFEPKLTSIEGR